MNHKLHTKKRSYYLNYYQNRDQSNIVELIEIKANTTQKKILIFEEDLPSVIEMLNSFMDKKNDDD